MGLEPSMELKLPKNSIPYCPRYRKVQIGLDFPSFFIDGLKGLDKDFHLVYHNHRTLWENIMNANSGSLEDPRYTINYSYGNLNFGWVLTDNEGFPLPDNSWHLYRLCWPHGYAHILKIEDTHNYYLKLVLNRLFKQAQFTERYGARAWNHKLDDEHTEEVEQQQKDKEYMMKCFQEENDWLLRKSMESFGRGQIKPTNPTKDIIFSGRGVSNRSRIVRPLTDREGGVYVG